MSTLPKNSLVLVSGANGLIASRVVDTLLEHGYRVRGTVREESKADWLKEYVEAKYGSDKLEIAIVPDMGVVGSFDEAIKGTKAFIHVASDVSFNTDPEQVIPGTVQGAESALQACANVPDMQHFVYTSSVAGAYVIKLDTAQDITEDSFADDIVDLAHQPGPMQSLYVYSASKALAEKKVLDYARQTKPHFTINTVVPNFNMGPLMAPGKQRPGSAGLLIDFYEKGWDGLGMFTDFPSQHYVDVRDTAALHVAPLLDPTIRTERLFAAVSSFHFNEILAILKRLRPHKKFPDPSTNTSRDLFNIIPTERANQVLKKNFGRGFYSLEESVAGNIAHLE